MNIEDLTIREARELAKMFGGKQSTSHSLKVGHEYLIRTVTMTQTGRITAITDTDIVLEEAAWVASTGRFYDALNTGKLEEVEPFPNGCIVSRAAIVDIAPWMHDLPREQK